MNLPSVELKSHSVHVVPVKHVCKDQKKYYEELLAYSRQHLMLYPYHLSEYMIRGLRVTPFSYYYDMMKNIMASERSYDSLPNFTAADCKSMNAKLLHSSLHDELYQPCFSL